MPSIFTLRGNEPVQPETKRGIAWLAASVAGIVVGFAAWKYAQKKLPQLRDASMLKVIAAEAKTPEEFARRADAWNAAEREPISQQKLVNAYVRTDPRGRTKMSAKLRRLLREAEERRREARERLWSKMSKGLRGLKGYRVAFLEAGKRAVADFDFKTADDAAGMVRRYKRRGWTAWVEDERGNFVPVKGATKKPTHG